MIYSTTEAAPATNNAILAQIRAYREKHKLPAPGDPLVIEKVRLDRYLTKHGHFSNELPPDFWSQDRELRGFIVGQILGPDAPAAKARAEASDAKRLKRMIAAGYPADYYSHPDDERKHISDVVRQRRRRALTGAPDAKACPLIGIPVQPVTREWIADRLATMNLWTKGTTPLARQLRGRVRELVKAAALYQMLAVRIGREPSHAELARSIGCKRRAAQNKRRLLMQLYSPGGPWHAKA